MKNNFAPNDFEFRQKCPRKQSCFENCNAQHKLTRPLHSAPSRTPNRLNIENNPNFQPAERSLVHRQLHIDLPIALRVHYRAVTRHAAQQRWKSERTRADICRAINGYRCADSAHSTRAMKKGNGERGKGRKKAGRRRSKAVDAFLRALGKL